MLSLVELLAILGTISNKFAGVNMGGLLEKKWYVHVPCAHFVASGSGKTMSHCLMKTPS